MTTKTLRVATLWILVAFVLLGTAYLYLRPEPLGVSVDAALIRVPGLKEASGLAPSRRTAGLLWSHNDSGGQPVLYAFNTEGVFRGSVRLERVKNVDWEALASFELEGKAWLAIGDIGDNLGRRHDTVIRVIEEPPESQLSPTQALVVPIAWEVPFTYESGTHDCETMMVDTRLKQILLITKRTHPPELHRLPLQPASAGALIVAQRVGVVSHLPRPTWRQRLFPTATGRYRGQPTDGCISPDGVTAAVLTYGDVLLFSRSAGETWASAFQHEPRRLGPHGLPQAEALCFSRDGQTLFVTGEQRDPPLLRYELTSHQ